jgi:hypothetical protein
MYYSVKLFLFFQSKSLFASIAYHMSKIVHTHGDGRCVHTCCIHVLALGDSGI